MNADILERMRQGYQFKRRAKTNILAGTMYKKLLNKVVKTIANAKAAYMKNKIMNNLNNPKRLWKKQCTFDADKLLEVTIDKHLSWINHIDNIIHKLHSRIVLLNRAKNYLTLPCRKLFFNALIKPDFEYCCTVWGNTSNEQLLRVLRVQKRCGS
jgi:hypothetical protein